MEDKVKVNIHHIHGPTTIKLAHCFRLAVIVYITFLLFQDFIKYFCRQIPVGFTTTQQCKCSEFFREDRMLVTINVFFCFTVTTVFTCAGTSTGHMQYLHHLNINKANKTPVSDCNSINPNATSVSDLTSVRYNNNTSPIIPQCYFKKPLEYQGSRTILT